MTTVGAIVTFSVTWWLFLFTVLPIGVRPQDDPVPGSDLGAPQKTYLWQKMLAATVLAGLATWALAWFIDSGLINLRPQ